MRRFLVVLSLVVSAASALPAFANHAGVPHDTRSSSGAERNRPPYALLGGGGHETRWVRRDAPKVVGKPARRPIVRRLPADL